VISKYCFSYCSHLDSVKFENGSECEIEPEVFVGSNVQHLELPMNCQKVDGLESFQGVNVLGVTVNCDSRYFSIDDKRFLLSENGKRVVTYLGSDEKLVIPAGCETIGRRAMKNSNIVSVKICKGLIKIEEEAFKGSKRLDKLEFEVGSRCVLMEEGAFFGAKFRLVEGCPRSLVSPKGFDRGVTWMYVPPSGG
jgi:hypothetical protein